MCKWHDSDLVNFELLFWVMPLFTLRILYQQVYSWGHINTFLVSGKIKMPSVVVVFTLRVNSDAVSYYNYVLGLQRSPSLSQWIIPLKTWMMCKAEGSKLMPIFVPRFLYHDILVVYTKNTHIFFPFLRYMDTLTRGKSVKIVYFPSENWSPLKGKNLLPLGANSFLLEKTLLSEGLFWCEGKQTGSHRNCHPCINGRKMYQVYPVPLTNIYLLQYQ